tara:strand:- start:1166 stop:1993 length:828 start_codon:yes stop_codon:yes gene_type:complete
MVYKYYISPRNNFEKSEPPKKNESETKTDPDLIENDKTDPDLIEDDSLGLIELITKMEEIKKLIEDLKAQQKQLKILGKIKKKAQKNKPDPQYIQEKKARSKKLAKILADIKYKQVILDNLTNPLPTNIEEANNRVLQETQAENARRSETGNDTLLPSPIYITIRFFKGIAKKINKRGISYSATIRNNGHHTMLGSWNNYKDAVLTLDYTYTFKEKNGVLFYRTIDQDNYYIELMAKRLPKKGEQLTMPTFLPLKDVERQIQMEKDRRKYEKTTV